MNENEDKDLSKSNSNSKEVKDKENSSELSGEAHKAEDEAKDLEGDVAVAPVVDGGIEVIRALSGFAAEQSHIAMQGIVNWTGLDEEVGTEFARDVLSSYSNAIQQAMKSDPSRAQGIAKMLLSSPEKRGELVAAFLFSIEPSYRNAWMQLLLQSVGCFEIAGKTFKIQGEVYKADPKLFDDLKSALLNSVKPELKDDVIAIVDSASSFLKKA